MSVAREQEIYNGTSVLSPNDHSVIENIEMKEIDDLESVKHRDRHASVRLSILNPQLAKKLKKFDTANDGELQLNEAIQGLVTLQKQSNNYKKIIYFMFPIFIILLGCMFGTTMLALKLSKDTAIVGQVMRTMSGDPVKVQTTYASPIDSNQIALGNTQLNLEQFAYSDFITVNNDDASTEQNSSIFQKNSQTKLSNNLGVSKIDLPSNMTCTTGISSITGLMVDPTDVPGCNPLQTNPPMWFCENQKYYSNCTLNDNSFYPTYMMSMYFLGVSYVSSARPISDRIITPSNVKQYFESSSSWWSPARFETQSNFISLPGEFSLSGFNNICNSTKCQIRSTFTGKCILPSEIYSCSQTIETTYVYSLFNNLFGFNGGGNTIPNTYPYGQCQIRNGEVTSLDQIYDCGFFVSSNNFRASLITFNANMQTICNKLPFTKRGAFHYYSCIMPVVIFHFKSTLPTTVDQFQNMPQELHVFSMLCVQLSATITYANPTKCILHNLMGISNQTNLISFLQNPDIFPLHNGDQSLFNLTLMKNTRVKNADISKSVQKFYTKSMRVSQSAVFSYTLPSYTCRGICFSKTDQTNVNLMIALSIQDLLQLYDVEKISVETPLFTTVVAISGITKDLGSGDLVIVTPNWFISITVDGIIKAYLSFNSCSQSDSLSRLLVSTLNQQLGVSQLKYVLKAGITQGTVKIKLITSKGPL